MEFDVIVVGAGHAGLEAAFAPAKLGMKTCLITLHEESIGMMPCNPSIGGPAKGIVTREIDALGGMQGVVADATQLQMKLLNSAKGPGVWSLRAQIDKVKYHEKFVELVKQQKNLTLLIDEVTGLWIENNQIFGVLTEKNQKIKAKTVILTTGTYMKSVTHRGSINKTEGPDGLKFSRTLSDQLREMGLETIRLKTGTPPRLLKSSIDFSKFQEEPGSKEQWSFSHFNQVFVPFEEQTVCHVLHTGEKTHQLIRDHLKDSAMYGGYINSIGPRYCPSIEDKIVKFSEKPRHQLFLEPESASLDTIYLGGFSTSMPEEVQEKMVHSLAGLEDCVIVKYAYAIEYDAINPLQIDRSLMVKSWPGLFTAGQINGTSGYEEAAAQGLMAGINATKWIKKEAPLILGRDEAYIGVMIDDLTTKGVTEPYRLLTSRAEHRLYLRNDNADDRLINYGYEIGLISSENFAKYQQQKALIDEVIELLKKKTIGQVDALKFVVKKTNFTLYEYLKRPEVKLVELLPYIGKNPVDYHNFLVKKIEIAVKFEGYIKNQEEAIRRMAKIPKLSLTKINDYREVPNISLEAIDKLNRVKPDTLDQASRISGINLVDIIKLKFYLETH